MFGTSLLTSLLLWMIPAGLAGSVVGAQGSVPASVPASVRASLSAQADPEALASLEPRLRAADAEQRRRAVAELALLGSPAALERLIGMLADVEGRVADEAQSGLGAWPRQEHAARILAALDERRGALAPRVAEALGRLPFALDADALAATLRARDAAVRALLCFSVERLARAGRIAGDPATRLVPALEGALSDREPRVRADALLALQALAPERCAQPARAFAQEARLEQRAAAAIAAGLLPEPLGLPLAAGLAADPCGAVRVRAAQALAHLGTPAAARSLAERLGSETEARVVRELVELLRSLSGLRHGRDPRPWLEWADGLGDGWRPSSSAGATGTSEPAPGATAAFAGLPIQSDRVVFLIDLSGSMWDEREGGRTRKQAVDGELRSALESLPAQASFNVIGFTGDTWPWRKSLATAGERSVREVLRFFTGLRHRGQGDYWGALMLALADPEVDTVIVLGDGRPSGGERWNLELMRVLLEHENRYRAVVVDAVLVDLSPRIERLWRALTALTGGRSIEVAL